MKKQLYRDGANRLVASTSERIAEYNAYLIKIRERTQETQQLITYAKQSIAESMAILQDGTNSRSIPVQG